MKFEWDEAKRQTNLHKHRLDFAEAEIIFSGATFTFEDNRYAYGEDRFITLGLLKGAVVVIAHTERNEVIRIISLRKATKYEQQLYFQSFSD
ncbi:MAG: BrnT family toxin [Anaerolineales bacterium]|nr:BrnT family toxin [Anaerolineales bacterium]